MNKIPDLIKQWMELWPQALAIWSPYVKLKEPFWCFNNQEKATEHLSDSFAAIRLTDHKILLSLPDIQKYKLETFALEILSHEIGHHVYCPGDLTDHGRLLARIRAALYTHTSLAGMVANLYSDLLINDRLQRSAKLNMAGVYQALIQNEDNRMWTLYMRIYEILWSLNKGSLTTGNIDDTLNGDAYLGARLIRVYAKNWLAGAGRFAMLLLPYLEKEDWQQFEKIAGPLWDTEQSGVGGMPAGLVEIEPEELEGAIHPALDEKLTGIKSKQEKPLNQKQSTGQYRQPFEYGELLRSLGLALDDHEAAVHYYKERARSHLIPFPSRELPESKEPLPEGLEIWDVGAPLENIDWLGSVTHSPHVIPGVTTMQRTYGKMVGQMPQKEPLDLDLYVDCSGSMPNPQHQISYLTLAGAIISLSALRSGARVQATLWSGVNEFETTEGFITDEVQILRILTGYMGWGTAFPIHILRDTYHSRQLTARNVHILVISDDGVDTMFREDEQRNKGWDIARMALEKAKGGGTLALQMYQGHLKKPVFQRATQEGWQISLIQEWEDLIAFARHFSKMKYGT